MDAYLIACFVAIIALTSSIFFFNRRIENIEVEVEQLRNELNK